MASIIKVDQIQTAAGGTPTAGDLGINTSGNVVQVKTLSVPNPSTHLDTASSSFVSMGVSLTITPKDANNTILIIWSGTAQQAGGSAMAVYTTVYKNGSNMVGIYGMNHTGSYGNNAITTASNTFCYADTAGSTNAITYEIYGRGNGNNCIINHSQTGYSFTLLEIAG